MLLRMYAWTFLLCLHDAMLKKSSAYMHVHGKARRPVARGSFWEINDIHAIFNLIMTDAHA